jgi:hypothetical protein
MTVRIYPGTDRSGSSIGLPIIKEPAEILAKFIPMEFVNFAKFNFISFAKYINLLCH